VKTAARWLANEGIVTLSPAGEFPSLATYVSGESITGNWWSHPRANDIYNLFQKLSSSPNVIVAKLVDGKVTLIHKRFWPNLVRLAMDDTYRNKSLTKLTPLARAVLSQVEKHGSVRMDFLINEMGKPQKELKKARELLERLCLTVSHDEHTADGHHEVVLEAWPTLVKRKNIKVPNTLSFESALSSFQIKLGMHQIPFSA
jgi:hypothetical protein